MNRIFKAALKRAGNEHFTWHCLRHTFATRLVMVCVDIRTVQELMGHKTLAMTLRDAHLSPQHRLEAMQRLTQRAASAATGPLSNTHKSAR